MKFFIFFAICSHTNQPCPKSAFVCENQAHEVNLPKMGKSFTTVVGQSVCLQNSCCLSRDT